MTHNSSATVQVTNNFAYAADITINHTYDTSPVETHSWKMVMPGTTSDPDMVITFNLGFFHGGHDTYIAEVDVLDGPNKGRYISDVAQCTNHSGDNGAVLTFSVGKNGFVTASSRNHDAPHWATHP